MDALQTMREANAHNCADQQVAQARFKQDSRKKLTSIIEKKIRTAFIGALSQFEQRFGHLWGHRLPDDECTGEQLAMRVVWDETRTNILNNGNTQLRAAQSELLQYEVAWQRFQLKLQVQDSKEAQ